MSTLFQELKLVNSNIPRELQVQKIKLIRTYTCEWRYVTTACFDSLSVNIILISKTVRKHFYLEGSCVMSHAEFVSIFIFIDVNNKYTSKTFLLPRKARNILESIENVALYWSTLSPVQR